MMGSSQRLKRSHRFLGRFEKLESRFALSAAPLDGSGQGSEGIPLPPPSDVSGYSSVLLVLDHETPIPITEFELTCNPPTVEETPDRGALPISDATSPLQLPSPLDAADDPFADIPVQINPPDMNELANRARGAMFVGRGYFESGALFIDCPNSDLKLEFLDSTGAVVRYDTGSGPVTRRGVTSIHVNFYMAMLGPDGMLYEDISNPTPHLLTVIGSSQDDSIQAGYRDAPGMIKDPSHNGNLKFGRVPLTHNFNNLTIDTSAGIDRIAISAFPTIGWLSSPKITLKGGLGDDQFVLNSFGPGLNDMVIHGDGGNDSLQVGAIMGIEHLVTDVPVHIGWPCSQEPANLSFDWTHNPAVPVRCEFNGGIEVNGQMFDRMVFDGTLHIFSGDYELSIDELTLLGVKTKAFRDSSGTLTHVNVSFSLSSPVVQLETTVSAPSADNPQSSNALPLSENSLPLSPEQAAFYFAAQGGAVDSDAASKDEASRKAKNASLLLVTGA